MAQIKIGYGEDAEWVDEGDPYYWQAGVDRFTPEQAAEKFRQFQRLAQTQMRDNPNLKNAYPSFLFDPNIQWNDPRVTPWFGVDPNTGIYQGMRQQPYADDPNFGFKNALLATGLAFGAGGLASGAFGGAGAAGAGAGGTSAGAGAAAAGDSALTGLGNFSLASPGAGVGGVGQAGLGLGMPAGGGLIGETAAGLASAGGVGGLSAIPAGIGSGGATGLGLALTPGNLINTTANTLAQAGGVSLPSATGSGIPSTIRSPVPQTPGVGGSLSNTPSSIPSSGGNSPWEIADKVAKAAQAGGSFWDLIGGVGEAIGASKNRGVLNDAYNQAIQAADPFSSQRGQYQGYLRDTFTNPNWMAEDPTIGSLTNDQYIQDYANTDLMGQLGNENYLQSISDRIKEDVAKEMSAKGFMNSGNYGMELGRRLQQEIAPLSLQQQQAMAAIRQAQAGNILGSQQQRQQNMVNAGQNQQTFLGNLAGAQFGPGGAASLAADRGQQQVGSNNQLYGAIGNAVKSLPGVIDQIKGIFGRS